MSTNSAPRHGGESTFTVSGWTLRRKLALALAIPLVLAAGLGALRVRSDLVEADNSATSATQVEVLRPAIRYLVAAEKATVAAQRTDDKSKTDLEAAVKEVKSAAQDLESARDTTSLNDDQRYQVDVILDLSRALREGTETDTLSPGTWVAQLRQLQSGVTQLITTIVNAQIDPQPRLELLSQALGGRFSLAMQQALVATDRSGDTASLELFSEIGAEGVAIDRLASSLGVSEPAIATLRTANAERFRTVRTGGTDLGGADAYDEYDALIEQLRKGIDRELTTNANDSRARALAGAGITLGALVAAILLALLISRLILNPIKRVREGALSVAHEQLPQAVARLRAGQDPGRIHPIDVSSKEEVGQLARAVDDLHRQAVHLATGEAQLRSQVGDMFVTLSRRNTALVNQQLALIEDLEKDEEDPLRLESLFRLDHLAARMRRTADSLLILADAPGRAGTEGLTVGDAMQAATAGVQDYQRVHLGLISNLRISDAAAGDIVHVLTELVDNALRYSPPNQDVTITSVTRPGGVTVEVSDGGLGIPEESLQEFNQTLLDGGDVTPDTPRRMGLFVVSRLSHRHGLTALLQRNERKGITATVLLPSAILHEGAGLPVAAPSVAPVAEPAPTPVFAESVEPEGLESIENRISGALRLPVRRPGAALRDSDPLLGGGTPEAPAAAVPEPAVPERGPEPEPVAPAAWEQEQEAVAVWRPDPVARPAWERQLFADEVAPEAPEPVADRPAAAQPEPERPRVEEPAQPWQPAAVQSSPMAPEPQRPDPEPAAPRTAAAVAAGSGALDGEWSYTGGDDFDTPIFRAMRSNWLTADGPAQPWVSSEVEAGWQRADRVAAAEPTRNETGLPQRNPGARLVPGGVTQQTTTAARDPEAIRARLAAHAAGVSRGRHAAAATHDEHTEAGPS